MNFGHVVVLDVVQVRDDQDSSPTFSRIQCGSDELSWKYFCPINFCSNCITRPSNRDPNLRSWGNFLSDNSSCMFRKWQNHSIASRQHFAKKPTEPDEQRSLLWPCELCFLQLRWFLLGMGFTCCDSTTSPHNHEQTQENYLCKLHLLVWYDDTNVCKNFIVSCTVLFHDGSLLIQSNCHDCALMLQ